MFVFSRGKKSPIIWFEFGEPNCFVILVSKSRGLSVTNYSVCRPSLTTISPVFTVVKMNSSWCPLAQSWSLFSSELPPLAPNNKGQWFGGGVWRGVGVWRISHQQTFSNLLQVFSGLTFSEIICTCVFRKIGLLLGLSHIVSFVLST